MTDSQLRTPSNDHRTPDLTPVSLDQTVWLRRLQRGLSLLFWSLLLPVLGVNAVAFLLPLLGGDPSQLPWVSLIHTAGGVPVLIAAFMLLGPPPQPETDLRDPLLRRICLILAGFELLVRLSHNLIRLFDATAHLPLFDGICWLIWALFPIIGLICLRRLALRLTNRCLANRLRTFAVAYAACLVPDLVLSFWVTPNRQSNPARIALMVWSIGALPLISLWGLALVLCLRKLVVRCRLEHHCIHCQYDLTGNVSGVCPECGAKIDSSDGGDKP